MSPSVPVQNRATSAPCAPQRQWRHVLTRFLVPATAWRDAAAGALAPRWAPDVRSHALSRDSAGAVSALEQQQRQPQQGRPAPNGSGGDVGANLSGVWGKDERRSDLAAFERSLDLLGINGVQRVTAKLIDGIEIRQVSGCTGRVLLPSWAGLTLLWIWPGTLICMPMIYMPMSGPVLIGSTPISCISLTGIGLALCGAACSKRCDDFIMEAFAWPSVPFASLTHAPAFTAPQLGILQRARQCPLLRCFNSSWPAPPSHPLPLNPRPRPRAAATSPPRRTRRR
jgi:hypothetical protein